MQLKPVIQGCGLLVAQVVKPCKLMYANTMQYGRVGLMSDVVECVFLCAKWII